MKFAGLDVEQREGGWERPPTGPRRPVLGSCLPPVPKCLGQLS